MREIPGTAQPARGFGKGVNDYLNLFITLADAKAAGFVAASLTVGAAALKFAPTTFSNTILRWVALSALGVSLVLDCSVIVPRLPSGRRGLIFWEDIGTRGSETEYADEVSVMTMEDVEREYAAQNYFVSRVVHRKHRIVRWGIATFLVGTISAAAAFLLK